MRNDLPWWIIATFLTINAGCTPVDSVDNAYPGYIDVSEAFWRFDHDTPYPFTMDGELSCEDHPIAGKAVFFNPVGYTNEFYVGTPLNKAAQELLDLIDVKSNVPFTVKNGVDLKEIKALGESLCDIK